MSRDKRILFDLYPECNSINLTPLEIIKNCKPIKSVHYPHDLSMPLVINEPLFINYFDLVLWPFPWFGYYPQPNHIVTVGWIKNLNSSELSKQTYFNSSQKTQCFFFSEISTYDKKYGIEKTLERLTPLIKNKIPIKLPNWPTSPTYEKALKKCNAIIIPSHINSFDIIV